MDLYRVGSFFLFAPTTYIRADSTVIRPARSDRLTRYPEVSHALRSTCSCERQCDALQSFGRKKMIIRTLIGSGNCIIETVGTLRNKRDKFGASNFRAADNTSGTKGGHRTVVH